MREGLHLLVRSAKRDRDRDLLSEFIDELAAARLVRGGCGSRGGGHRVGGRRAERANEATRGGSTKATYAASVSLRWRWRRSAINAAQGRGSRTSLRRLPVSFAKPRGIVR